MRGTNQALMGVLVAFLAAAIVLGSLLLSLVEGGQALALLQSPTASPTPLLMTLPPGAPTYTPSVTPSLTPTETAAPPANCDNVPPGWQAIVIQPDETLSSIAASYGVSVKALRQGNCLATTTDLLNPGSFIFVPVPTASPTPLPPTSTPTLRPTRTSVPCGPPPGWTTYRVRPGDTLFALSVRLGVSEQALQAANCMGNSVTLYSGHPLWVPFIPLAPTIPPTRTPIPPPTFTITPLPPTRTPTRTSPPPTHTRPAPTNTPLTPTATTVPTTNTPQPATATNTPLPTATNTPLPAATNTPVPTATNTPLPTATNTPLPTATNTPLPTATNTPLPTSTNTSAPPPANTQSPSKAASASLDAPIASFPLGNGSAFASAATGVPFQFNVLGWLTQLLPTACFG